MADIRPPLPPFTHETAIQKVRAAEDAWNSCDPARVSLAYTPDSKWRKLSWWTMPETRHLTFTELQKLAYIVATGQYH